MAPSIRSQRALSHLQTIKPGDAWSIQIHPQQRGAVRLLRRGVPLTDNYFVDVHVDVGGDVLGLLTLPSSSSGGSTTTQGQVLVDAKGNVVRGMALRSVRIETEETSGPPRKPQSSRSSQSGGGSASANTDGAWTPEQHQQMFRIVGGVVAIAVAVRVVMQTLTFLYLLAVPILYLYLLGTCPSEDSFDAKQQLKRVLRGAHLPENHPDKPKGMLSEALARIQATVATELATLPGYEVTQTNVAGAIVVSCVRVPTAATDFYWVGAANRWMYVTSVQISNDDADTAGGGMRRSVRSKRD